MTYAERLSLLLERLRRKLGERKGWKESFPKIWGFGSIIKIWYRSRSGQLSLPGGKIVRWQKTAKLAIPCHGWQFAIAVRKSQADQKTNKTEFLDNILTAANRYFEQILSNSVSIFLFIPLHLQSFFFCINYSTAFRSQIFCFWQVKRSLTKVCCAPEKGKWHWG